MKRTILVAITLLLAITLQAQKRVNNHMFNPDPAPVVSGDRLYVFTGHLSRRYPLWWQRLPSHHGISRVPAHEGRTHTQD